MDSILVSYTDAVFNIDSAVEGGKEEGGKTEALLFFSHSLT